MRLRLDQWAARHRAVFDPDHTFTKRNPEKPNTSTSADFKRFNVFAEWISQILVEEACPGTSDETFEMLFPAVKDYLIADGRTSVANSNSSSSSSSGGINRSKSWQNRLSGVEYFADLIF